MKNIFLTLLCFFVIPSNAQDSNVISFLFGGDVMTHYSQIFSTYDPKTNTFDYSTWFHHIKDIVSKVDVAIVNLETTLAGKPYTGYPRFSAPDTVAYELKQAGFDVVATANNHSCDRGKIGIVRTIQQLEKFGLTHVGTYKDSNEYLNEYPLILEMKGAKVALLNYTYGTNGLPIPESTVVNLIDTTQIAKDIKKARELGAEFIIIFMHAGREYVQELSRHQKLVVEVGKKYGVDLIVGAHPHVVQRIDTIPIMWKGQHKTLLVAYSLGNLISNQRFKFTDGGVLLRVDIKKVGDCWKLYRAKYIHTWVYIEKSNGKKRYWVVPAEKIINGEVKIPETDYNKFYRTYQHNESILKPSPLKQEFVYFLD